MKRLDYASLSLLVALFAALAMASAPARAAKQICAQNTNGGAAVNAFIWRDMGPDSGQYTADNKMWAVKMEAGDNRYPCVGLGGLHKIKSGDRVMVGYQVKGKLIGKHTFTCGFVQMNTRNHDTVVLWVEGYTVFDSKCRFEKKLRGNIVASEVCFRIANHEKTIYRRSGDWLHIKGEIIAERPAVRGYTDPNAPRWAMYHRKKTDPAEQCVKLKDVEGVRPGDRFSARIISVHRSDTGKYDFAKCDNFIIANPQSRTKVVLQRQGIDPYRGDCERLTY